MSNPLDTLTAHDAAQLLYREAYLIDTQRFDDWLALLTPDCEYWVPAWKGEHETTSDPQRELSLIYYGARSGLEDRVWRVRSGRSVASTPMPRTQHAVTNVQLDAVEGGVARVLSNFTVHQFRMKSYETEVLYGRYEHRLVADVATGTLRIRAKHITLLNDYMPAMIDFYSL